MRYGTVCVSQGNEEKKNAGKNSQIKTGSITFISFSKRRPPQASHISTGRTNHPCSIPGVLTEGFYEMGIEKRHRKIGISGITGMILCCRYRLKW